jgi:hypothetical protein
MSIVRWIDQTTAIFLNGLGIHQRLIRVVISMKPDRSACGWPGPSRFGPTFFLNMCLNSITNVLILLKFRFRVTTSRVRHISSIVLIDDSFGLSCPQMAKVKVHTPQVACT